MSRFLSAEKMPSFRSWSVASSPIVLNRNYIRSATGLLKCTQCVSDVTDESNRNFKGQQIETKSQKQPFTLAYSPSSLQLPAKRKVCLPFSYLSLFLFSPHAQLLGFTSFLCIWFACRSNYDPYLGTSSGFVGGDIETLVLLVHFSHLFMSLLLITTYYFSIIASTIISKTVFVSGGGGGGSGLFSSPVHSLNLFNSFVFLFFTGIRVQRRGGDAALADLADAAGDGGQSQPASGRISAGARIRRQSGRLGRWWWWWCNRSLRELSFLFLLKTKSFVFSF